jgi:hypothetical protein
VIARRAPLAAALGVLVLAGVLGACSEEHRVGEAEDGIAAVLGERLGADGGAVEVSCPDDAELETGDTLECEVVVDDGDPQAVAFAIGEEGSVSPTAAVIPTGAVEDYLAAELATAAEGEVAVDCGESALVVHDVGGTFTCTAVRTSDGVVFDVTVEVRSLDGSVTYTVAATTTTTTTVPAVDPNAPTTAPA